MRRARSPLPAHISRQVQASGLVDAGTCVVSDTPGENYDVSLMMAPPEFTKMVTGRGNPTMLVMRGKIKVKGDIALAAKFPSLFDIPKA